MKRYIEYGKNVDDAWGGVLGGTLLYHCEFSGYRHSGTVMGRDYTMACYWDR